MKRFTACEKWDKEWFQNLSLKHKLLWVYLCDRCDFAGVWEPNFSLASFQIGERICEEDLQSFGGRIIKLECGKFWLEPFIRFQYGELSAASKPHIAVLRKIETLSIPYANPLEKFHGVQDKDKEKDIYKGGVGENAAPLINNGFPENETEAINRAMTAGVPSDFVRTAWLECDARKGTDRNGNAITNWASYVKAAFNRRKDWEAKNPQQSNKRKYVPNIG